MMPTSKWELASFVLYRYCRYSVHSIRYCYTPIAHEICLKKKFQYLRQNSHPVRFLSQPMKFSSHPMKLQFLPMKFQFHPLKQKLVKTWQI